MFVTEVFESLWNEFWQQYLRVQEQRWSCGSLSGDERRYSQEPESPNAPLTQARSSAAHRGENRSQRPAPFTTSMIKFTIRGHSSDPKTSPLLWGLTEVIHSWRITGRGGVSAPPLVCPFTAGQKNPNQQGTAASPLLHTTNFKDMNHMQFAVSLVLKRLVCNELTRSTEKRSQFNIILEKKKKKKKKRKPSKTFYSVYTKQWYEVYLT